MKLYLDLETRSYRDVKTVGGYRYAYDDSTSILLFAYAIDDGEISVIEFDKTKIQALLDAADMIIAHNSMFDRVVLKAQGFETYDHKWFDTMIQAYAHSYAGSLATLSKIFGLAGDTAKDADGKRLIKLFSVPQKNGAFFSKATHPLDWQLFVNYANSDIAAMREIHKKLPDLNYKFGGFEHGLWLLDQKINDTGVAVDTELAEAAVDMIDAEAARLGIEAQDLTDGDLVATTQTLKSRKFIKAQFGYGLPDLKKTTIEEFLNSNDDLPDDLVTFLENRNQTATSSAGKYKTVVESNVDGRLHGTLQFCGANRTGRWSGRLFQPQNLPRPELSQTDIDLGIELIKQGCPELLTDNLMQLASSCIRGLIVPSKGNKLVVSDLSAIEGRTLMWLAGEQWELDAYARGEDIYKLTYGKAFGVPIDKVTKDQRQIGKVMVLALGYQGGVGAFVNFATIYGIDLDELAKQVMPTLPVRIIEKSKSTYEWVCKMNGTPDMPKFTWLAIDGLKVLWRESHPKTAKLWKTTEDKVKEAIANKGKPLDINDKLRVMCSKDDTLMIKLPSGRYLCYPNAHVKNNKVQFSKALGKGWIKGDSYGGKFVENCIAENTLVVTNKGLKPIQHIDKNDLIWDGVKFVAHNGLINKGRQKVMEAHGVIMTPDHKVLTDEGWKNASQSTGFNRTKVGLPYNVEMGALGWEKINMVGGMRMRNTKRNGWLRIRKAAEKRGNSILRLYAKSDNRQKAGNPQYEQNGHFCGLSINAATLRQSKSQSLPQLWREGDNYLQSLARVLREFLRRYALNLSKRIGARQGGQQCGLQQRELPLGYVYGKCEQQTHKHMVRDTQRENDSSAGIKGVWDKGEHYTLPYIARLGSGESTDNTANVYDILNCGDLQRFVVIDNNGEPLIVHNCTQAAARDILAYNMPAIAQAGTILLTVHDEIIVEVPVDSEFTHEKLSALLATQPSWANGLPLNAEGFEALRYRKD